MCLWFSLQVWQCGGSMEVLPCARVAHIERTKKPYNNDIDYYAKRNALRAAEVWMDEYKSHVYMAWNIPMNVSLSLCPDKKSICRSLVGVLLKRKSIVLKHSRRVLMLARYRMSLLTKFRCKSSSAIPQHHTFVPPL